MKKVLKMTAVAFIGLILITLVYGVILWLAFGGGALFHPNPPMPNITYGEFPFRLMYELEGETKIVEDTLICEFDGFGANEARGKYRKWSSHLKSGNEKITLLQNNDIEIFFTPGMNDWEIGAVYMGDNEIYHNNINSTFPNAYCLSGLNATMKNAYIISGEEMWKNYKLKLISWEPSQPIKNKFK